MDQRKRAIFIINSLAGGGAERIMTTLLRASGPWRDRYDIMLVLLDQEEDAYSAPHWIDLVRLNSRGSLLSGIAALRRLLVRVRPDVTISFLTRANICNIVATRGLSAGCIISERVNSSAHFSDRGYPAAMISKALLRLSYPRAGHVIAVSSGVAQDLAHNFAVPQEKISIISNPVDHDLIALLGAEAPSIPLAGEYIAATGRLVPNKNFSMLIDAFARSALPCSLIILGDGPDRPKLEQQIARLGLDRRVLLPGFVANPFAILKRASLFALPSNAEGFPNGLVEAMACGLPVVATNCASGPSEILLNRTREDVRGLVRCEAGAVVPTNDTNALAEALRLAFNPATRKEQGAAAMAIARGFAIDQTTGRYWGAIEQTIARGRRGRLSAPGNGTAASNHVS